MPGGLLFTPGHGIGMTSAALTQALARQRASGLHYDGYLNAMQNSAPYSGMGLQQADPRQLAEYQWAQLAMNAAPRAPEPAVGPVGRAPADTKPVRTGVVSRMGFGGAV